MREIEIGIEDGECGMLLGLVVGFSKRNVEVFLLRVRSSSPYTELSDLRHCRTSIFLYN